MRPWLLSLILIWGSFSLYANDVARSLPSTQQGLLSFAPLVKQTAPAVVNIYTKRRQKMTTGFILNDPIFELFFGNRANPSIMQERVVQSLGSGVIIDARGIIVTNRHVIEGADEIRVILHDKREFDARLLVEDSKTDIALLKIQTENNDFPYLSLKDSDSVQVGDMVLAIGNPFGIGQTVTSGIISAVARTTVGVSDYQFFLQTDAAINPGNSGGALVTTDGRLIGINTAIFSKTGASNGIGFATPANIVKAILTSLRNDGKIIRPWVGAGFQEITSQIADSLGMKRPIGVLVQRVMDGSPAARAGVEVGDVITHFGEAEISDPQSLHYRIATYPIGSQAPLMILRKGVEKRLTLALEAPPQTPAPDYRSLSGNHALEGATVANISPALATELNLNIESEGVVITVIKQGSIAARIGFKPRDVIESLNGQRITNTAMLQSLLNGAGRQWRITALRDGQRLQLEWTR